jgi:putative membrane-bound dehydrogenase-like protein
VFSFRRDAGGHGRDGHAPRALGGGDLAAEAVAALVFEGGDADVALEELGEVALVAKPQLGCDLGDLRTLVLQRLASRLDAKLHDEGPGADAEGFDEFPVELALGEVEDAGQFLDRHTLAEVFADIGDGAVELEVGLEDFASMLVALHGAHDADDAVRPVANGEFIRDEPIGHALLGKEQLHDVRFRFASADDLLIVAAKALCEPWREEIEVLPADHLRLFAKAEPLEEAAAGADEAELPVLGEEGHVRHEIEDTVETAIGADAAEEPVAGGNGFGAGEGHVGVECPISNKNCPRVQLDLSRDSGSMMHIRPMKILLPLLLGTCLVASAIAAPGPIRVLYLGKEDPAVMRRCHVLMRELGRDAIWFEFASADKEQTPGWSDRFDAIWYDAPEKPETPGSAGRIDTFILQSTLEKTGKTQVMPFEFSTDERQWTSPAFIKDAREKLLLMIPDAREKEWEAFLSQREDEVREANPNVANYERRPQPLTFQKPMSVKGSMERTQVAPDLRLELFAGEPDIEKPIAMAWDERGRCWVCETSDYPHGVNPTGEGNDRIKICEDTNGDGKADKFTVFADKLNIPTSLVFAKGGVIVAQPPRFLFLKDTNGDDKADVREVVMEGWGIGDTHAQASNLHYGLDNWLYGCVGYSGFNGTVGGARKQFVQGTYRFRADGSAIEFLHQFTNNSWGHSTNAAGDQFGGTANGAPIFFGGIPAGAFPAGMRGMSAKKINVEDKVHTITPNFRQVDVFGGYTAAAGSAFIESANLPARLQGKAMVCEPTMKTISLMDVQRSGAGYTAKDGFNLVASSDEWMSPVFAEVGPDGAVWFADWQNFIIQHNPTPSMERGGYRAETGRGGAHKNDLRDHSRGRIYRVVWEKAAKPAIAPLGSATTAALVTALGSDMQERRLTAQRLLVDGRKTDAADALKKLVLANDGSPAAIHAVWTLHGLGLLDEATHKSALLAKSADLRRNAIRALGADAKASALFFGAGVISDPDLTTRLAAFVKLGDFATTPEIQTMVKALAADASLKDGDWLAEAVKMLARKHKAVNFKEGPNLLPNPGFETLAADGLPEGWKRRDYGSREANASVEWKVVTGPGMTHSGTNAVRVISRDNADTSFFAEAPLKPNTEYRLSGWVKAHAIRGKVSLNDHIGRAETERVTRESDWTEVDTTFNSGKNARASINILHVARGDGYFDDVKLAELIPESDGDVVAAGDVKRGEAIFLKHTTAACVLCHSLKGQGSTVGPALDGIGTRKDAAYIKESLLEPGKTLAEGYQQLGVSPMPPMGLILKPQEIEDIQAYLQTLK